MRDSDDRLPGWADGLDLDNLSPYTHPSAAWTRRGSNLALTWDRPDAPGLQSVSALLGWGGTPLTRRLLNWQVSEDGHTLPLALVDRNYRPDMVVERDAAPDDLVLTATAVWPARNALAVQFELGDLAGRPRTLHVRFDYPGQDCPPTWQGPYPLGESDGFRNLTPGVCASLEGEPPGCWATLFIHQEHGRNIEWVKSYVAGMPQTALEMTCLTDLSERTVTLAPGGAARFLVTLGFGQNRGRARAALRACQEAVRPPWTAADETRGLLAFLNSAPPPAPRYAGSAAHKRLYAHALAALEGLFIQGEGGYTGDRHVPWTTTDLLAIAFFWDTSFSCLGAREFSPQLCQEAIACFVDNPTPRGSLPGTLCDTHRAGEGQSPIMAWAAWSVYQRSHDRDWLAAVYPGLAGYCRYWFKYHSSARGLPQFYNAGQVADNDVRWDPMYQREIGNEALSGVESPDLAAFHVVEMQCLGRMAAELGLAAEAAAWSDHAARLAGLMVETMYFPEEAMFYDVREGTHEKYSGVKNPNMFLPLWAGAPLPAAEARRIIEGHMLNPAEFFRELPFPSVSYDNPQYDPGGYWRGRIWPHVVYWMIQTLWRHGYHAAAELTADRVLALFRRTPWLHENYHSGTGAGWDDAHAMGFPDYNWSCATAIELLLERYKDPLV